MAFNSYEFIFLFLPISLFVFYKIGEFENRRLPITWLVAASIFFYAWVYPAYLWILLLSIGVNYSLGVVLTQLHLSSKDTQSKILLITGILFNVGLLGYYKYTNFFIETLNSTLGTSFLFEKIVFPLGISFYTFQQIAYLIDAKEGEAKGYKFLDYCLFVTFFSKISAGPIVSHQEIIPQSDKRETFKFNQEDIAVGLFIFFLGLFKKLVLGDNIASYATPVFESANQGLSITFFESWIGAIAYNLQIYFDFSGYSDMAIGTARMFGFKFPLNFNSPYKAVNIIDFWGRWHMTLTRFLTRYVYNPITLSVSRRRIAAGKSVIKRGIASPSAFIEIVAMPTIFTMFISGLWHGAGWQYIIFGLLHGSYLVINHGWLMIRRMLGHDLKKSSWWGRVLGQLTTFIAVLIAHVFFRAKDVNSANAMLASMIGVHGVSLDSLLELKLGWLKSVNILFDGMFHNNIINNPTQGIYLILFLLIIALFFPNSQEWIARYQPALDYKPNIESKYQPKWLANLWQKFQWSPNRLWAIITSAISIAGILSLSKVSEFIYFKF